MNISTKIITPIVVSLGIFLGAVEFALVPYYKDKQLEAIIEGQHSELQVLAPIIAEELIAGDLAKIFTILQHQERIHAEESEGGIVLINQHNQQLYPLNKRVAFHEGNTDYLIIEEELHWGGELLGKFRYELEIEHELAHITEQLIVMRAATALVILFIIIFGGWWNRKLVIRPLEELQTAAKNIQEENYDSQLQRHSDDEIADVYRAFNKMHTTISKQNSELREALVTAEAAAHTKSRFLANMSHEIRTPMNAIIGLTHLVLLSELNNEQRSYLLNIQQSSKGLLGIINDILDFSKIEADQLDIENTPFSLDEILFHTHTLNQLKAKDNELEFSVSRPFNIPDTYRGDPLRITQVLTNLVGNAIKFTKQGYVRVDIEYQKHNEQSLLSFIVTDSGIGISKQHQQNLFSAFNQADVSTTRQYGGTGLGLSISLQLAHLMGGDIRVISEENQGSTFIFELPLEPITDIDNSQQPDANLKGKGFITLGNTSEISTYIQHSGALILANENNPQEISTTQLDRFIQDKKLNLILLGQHDNSADIAQFLTKINQQTPAPIPVIMLTEDSKVALEPLALPMLPLTTISSLRTPSAIHSCIIEKLKAIHLLTSTHESTKVQLPTNELLLGSRILLVEDNPINTQVAKGMLTRLGIEVSCCADGKQALDLLNSEVFDLILMDVHMPVIDGYTTTRMIRENPLFSELPIIALTANAMVDDEAKSLTAGMNAHLTKPINPDQLKTTLLKFLKSTRKDSGQIEFTAQTSTTTHDIFPNLDFENTLQRIGGEKEVYLQLLQQFAAQNNHAVEQFELFLNTDDFSALKSLAHSIKGAAATLGATHIQDLTALLEQTSDADSILAKPLITRFRDALDELKQNIDLLEHNLQTDKTPLHGNGTDNSILIKLVNQLRTLTEKGDVSRLELANPLLSAAKGTPYCESVEAICNKLDNFDFDEAHKLICQLRAESQTL